ncbi:MAG: UDP-N-acetylmuramoyl-L-alanine--D-glutamate ligase [Coriobacteriia bacterium]
MPFPRIHDLLVLGLGKSGRATALRGAELMRAGEVSSVTVIDSADTPALRATAEELRALGIEVRLGQACVEGSFDYAIASPGIKPASPLMESAKASGAHVVSEIEFAFVRSERTWVAITGTNGKTTTTALVEHLLNAAHIPAAAVGNIGTAASGCLDLDSRLIFVAEVSSFQLALTERFRPKVAVLLNITPDHVDWHGSLEAYAEDKAKVFANMGEGDVAVIDVDDAGSAPYADKVEARGVRVVRVSRTHLHPGGASVIDGGLVLDAEDGPVRVIAASELQIKGQHNVSNALAGMAAAAALGAPVSSLAEGLRSFTPIEHRLEPVAVLGGVEWFNDSKATNPDAVLKALTAFEGRSLIILLGGRNKGNDFRPLAEAVAAQAKLAVLFGESREEFSAAFEGLSLPTLVVPTLADAIEAAREAAAEGDVAVLSPACASFDEFTSYEDRGRVFKRLVRQTPA